MSRVVVVVGAFLVWLAVWGLAAAQGQTCYQAQLFDNGNTYTAATFEAAVQPACSARASAISGGGTTYTCVSQTCTPSGVPTATARTASCSTVFQAATSSGNTNAPGSNYTVTSISAGCPNNPACTAKAGQEAFMGGGAPASGNVCDGGGCEVATSQPTTVIRGSGAPSGPTIYQSTYTGNTCAAGPTAGETAAQCLSGAAGTTCAVAAANAGGKNCGTFNGDEVCVQSIPPGTCQSYASGGVACTAASGTMVPSPPGPNNGTAGTAATPTGSVTNNTNTTNYYSSSVVNNSSSVVATNPGGSNAGNGATGATGSTGSGNGPSAGNGDCGASGVDCGSDGSTPTLPDEPTVLETAQSYYGALGAVPIVAAVSGIGASIPAGSCPTATYSVFGREFTMDAQCALWDSIAPILELIMLAVYTLIGVRILMSA